MKEKIEIKSEIEIYNDFSDLSEQEQLLVKAASGATENAYAPYSKFQVGAAILLENNEIITGSNQENGVYPLGLCAERVALFTYGNKKEESKIKFVAVATNSKFEVNAPVFPCGSCRHVILEFEKRQNKNIGILVISNEKIYKVKTVKDILPFAFDGDFLK